LGGIRYKKTGVNAKYDKYWVFGLDDYI